MGINGKICPPPIDLQQDVTVHVNPGGTNTVTVPVPVNINTVTFSTGWTGSDVVMTLNSPSGKIINRTSKPAGIVHELGPNYEIFKFDKPETGEWKVDLFGKDVPAAGEDVILNVSAIEENKAPVAVCK
jgi:hypothetical protein